MRHRNHPRTTMADRIRLTITVTPEVHAAFTRMAEVSGVSIGRCMGDWLGDTVEGALFVSMKIEEAKRSPQTAMRELKGHARQFLQEVSEQASDARSARLAAASAAAIEAAKRGAPSSNTGLKVTGKGAGKGRR